MTRRNIFRYFLGLAGTQFVDVSRGVPVSQPSGPTGIPPVPIKIPQTLPDAEIPAWLRQWHQAPMVPIIESIDSLERTLIAHQFANASLTIRYANSSDGSHTPRSITPILLFGKDDYPDSTYLLAWCHSRKAPRVFKTAHISLG
jgi:predicted DNA-binding transcriptional regulator YafY